MDEILYICMRLLGNRAIGIARVLNQGSRMKVGKVAVKMVIHSKKIVCN